MEETKSENCPITRDIRVRVTIFHELHNRLFGKCLKLVTNLKQVTIMAEAHINIIFPANLKGSNGTDRDLKMYCRAWTATESYRTCRAPTKQGLYIFKGFFFLSLIHHCTILKSRTICYWYTLRILKVSFFGKFSKMPFIRIRQEEKLELWEITLLMRNMFHI